MCGIFGIYNHAKAAEVTHLGLYSLQHRGQESAGVVAVDGANAKNLKRMGLVSEGFTPAEMETMTGNIAIGHTRYSTAGSSTIENAQPVLARFATATSRSRTTAISRMRPRCGTSSRRRARSSARRWIPRCSFIASPALARRSRRSVSPRVFRTSRAPTLWWW